MTLRGFSIGTIVKLVLLCLIVGLALSFFGIGPEDFWAGIGNLARRSLDALRRAGEWAGPYILIGAAVVVPIWLLRLLYLRLRR